MKYESIADIYSANEKIREGFNAAAASITPDEAGRLADGEKWTPAQLVEHVSMVTGGVTQICSRLVKKAEAKGIKSDGRFAFSPRMAEQLAQNATAKLEAPDFVQPSGSMPLEESLNRLAAADEAFSALRPRLESIDISGETFPHPYFGPLTAAEWLALAGLHENRHHHQLETLLVKIRQK